MSQQINLYQPIFRTQKKVFSALTILQVAGVFLLGLLAIYGYGRWQVAALQAEVTELELRRDTAIDQLQAVTRSATPDSRAHIFEDQLREARRDRDRLTSMLSALERGHFGDPDGFSGHLSGLARQRVNGLWLTRVLVRDGGLELEGRTEAAELLPRYLARLGRESAFAGMRFARYELARGEKPGDPVSFTMTTASVEPSE